MTDVEQALSLSSTLGGLHPSMTLAITAKAKSMAAAGEEIISLSAGEPDFDTPDFVKQAAIDALNAGETKYTPASGREELRRAVAEKLAKENDISYSPEQIVVTPGAKYALFETLAVLCTSGEEVIIPVPYWLSYPEMVQAAGASPVFVETTSRNGYCLDPDVLEAHLTSRTKALIINSPANPSGGVYDRARLERIADIAVRNNLMIVSDEIYEKLVYNPEKPHVSPASLGESVRERTVTVNGFSKAFSMTGWRLGYLAAPDWLIASVKALQSHTTSNPTSFVQSGGMAALQNAHTFINEMCETFRKRRDHIYKRLCEIPGVSVDKPEGAFYIFPDISATGLDSMTFAERLLTEEKLAVIPGKPFGADGCIRLSYAYNTDTIDAGCDRLAAFCRKFGQ